MGKKQIPVLSELVDILNHYAVDNGDIEIILLIIFQIQKPQPSSKNILMKRTIY